MNRVFLGPVFHWLIVIALVALGWFGGAQRLHVSHFNPFILALIAIIVAAVLAVLLTSSPGQQVTRDAIEEPDDDTAT